MDEKVRELLEKAKLTAGLTALLLALLMTCDRRSRDRGAKKE